MMSHSPPSYPYQHLPQYHSDHSYQVPAEHYYHEHSRGFEDSAYEDYRGAGDGHGVGSGGGDGDGGDGSGSEVPWFKAFKRRMTSTGDSSNGGGGGTRTSAGGSVGSWSVAPATSRSSVHDSNRYQHPHSPQQLPTPPSHTASSAATATAMQYRSTVDATTAATASRQYPTPPRHRISTATARASATNAAAGIAAINGNPEIVDLYDTDSNGSSQKEGNSQEEGKSYGYSGAAGTDSLQTFPSRHQPQSLSQQQQQQQQQQQHVDTGTGSASSFSHPVANRPPPIAPVVQEPLSKRFRTGLELLATKEPQQHHTQQQHVQKHNQHQRLALPIPVPVLNRMPATTNSNSSLRANRENGGDNKTTRRMAFADKDIFDIDE